MFSNNTNNTKKRTKIRKRNELHHNNTNHLKNCISEKNFMEIKRTLRNNKKQRDCIQINKWHKEIEITQTKLTASN